MWGTVAQWSEHQLSIEMTEVQSLGNFVYSTLPQFICINEHTTVSSLLLLVSLRFSQSLQHAGVANCLDCKALVGEDVLVDAASFGSFLVTLGWPSWLYPTTL